MAYLLNAKKDDRSEISEIYGIKFDVLSNHTYDYPNHTITAFPNFTKVFPHFCNHSVVLHYLFERYPTTTFYTL